MNKLYKSVSIFIVFFLSIIIYNPMLVCAEELATETESSEEIGPITAFIALIVLIVVAYFVYHLLYDNTAIIGTRNGVNYALGRRLAIPFICGGGAAWLVVKVLNFLSGILTILIIIAIIAAVIFIIAKIVSKKGQSDDDSTTENLANASNATDVASEIKIDTPSQQRMDSTGEHVSVDNNTEKSAPIPESEIVDEVFDLNNIMKDIKISESDCETGTPIQNSELLIKARKYFEIPANENVYLIFDTTIMSSCKNGFAICETGIYSKLKQQRYMPWDEFKDKQIEVGTFLCIGGDEFNIGTKKMKKLLYDLLCRIQRSLD